MRNGRVLLLLALLLAGCTGGTPATPPTTTTPPGPVAENALVAIDGRWDFDADAAAKLAGHADAGRLWMGEASWGSAAGDVWGLDAQAARLLHASDPPAPGSVVAREGLGLNVGDELRLAAWTWPAPLVTAAFEMDRVRPCGSDEQALLCAMPQTSDGRARLQLKVPPGSRDVRYHPDVVELRDADYPASWEGDFVAPDGRRTPFHTAARTRTDLDPPGIVAGDVAEGAWVIEFTLTLNGTRSPGAVAGFVTYRTPGFAAFDTDLLRTNDSAQQTRRALDAARERTLTVRVGALAPATRMPAPLLLAPEDARELLNVSAGNATALVVPYAQEDEARVASAAMEQSVPALRALRLRPLVAQTTTPARSDLQWAPAGNATLLAGRIPPAGAATFNGTALAPGVRILALPADGALPWTLVPGAHWPTEDEAARTIATSAHLVLVSEDLAREAGLDPTKVAYAQLQVESGLGPRALFVMGAVKGGPARTVWASAALVTVLTAPAGGRALDGGVLLA